MCLAFAYESQSTVLKEALLTKSRPNILSLEVWPSLLCHTSFEAIIALLYFPPSQSNIDHVYILPFQSIPSNKSLA